MINAFVFDKGVEIGRYAGADAQGVMFFPKKKKYVLYNVLRCLF
jgi:hypothetical protein